MNDLKKRYYWLKLPKGFFKRHDMRIIEGMPNGTEYCLFYMKLLCESIDHEGNLRFSDEIPYTPEMLAVITDTNVDVARNAMDLLQKLRLLEVDEDSTIFMTELPEMIGSETGMARYMRERRALEEPKKELGEFRNVRLTDRELKELKEFYPSYWRQYIEKLSMFKESTGKEYASDFATLKSWLTEDIGEMEEE